MEATHRHGSAVVVSQHYGEHIEVGKKEPLTEEGTYRVYTGAVILIAKSEKSAGAIGFYFEGDEVCVTNDCWIEGLVDSGLFKIQAIPGLETNQFVDACIRQLDQRNHPAKDMVYNLLMSFTTHRIKGVKIVDMAKVLGLSREIVGKHISELIKDGIVVKVSQSHWKIRTD